MTTAPSHEVPLVNRLIELARRQDRGALAALRSGVGKPPGAAARMLPLVAPFLTSDAGPATRAAFVTAALFATHPEQADVGSLGASLWRATKRDANPNGKHLEAGVEARFAALLDADPEDLPRHLEGIVSLCTSAGVPLDWHRFYSDLRALFGANDDVRVRIHTRWARDFWRRPAPSNPSDQPTEENTDA